MYLTHKVYDKISQKIIIRFKVSVKKKICFISSHLFVICLITAFFSNTFAKETPSNTLVDPFFEEEIPIVLSATRLSQPHTEAPASISIIDREIIKLSGAKNIAEIFRLVPGMQVSYFRGNQPIVSYQGISSEFPQGVQVLIDGRSVYSPTFGGVDWANLPLVIEDIERIEVTRGPNNSSFGSNAFQSVINISTTHSSQTPALEVKSTLAERGYQRSILRAGQSFGDLDFRFTASHLDDNGYKHNHDDNRQDILNARIDYQATARDRIQINLGAVNSLRETVNPSNVNDPTDPRRHKDEVNYSLHTKWEHITKSGQQISTQASYTQHKSGDKISSFINNFNNLGPTNFAADLTAYYERVDFEIEHQLDPTRNTRLVWGAGLRSDRVSLPVWTDSKNKLSTSFQRLFANLEWQPTKKLFLNTGALWENTEVSGHKLSPRLAVNYLFTPTKSLRLIVSRAFRTPVLVESNLNTNLYFDTAAGELLLPLSKTTSTLVPETVDTFELGYHGSYLNNSFNVDLKLSRNEYDHLIDAAVVDTPNAITLNGVPVSNTQIHIIDNYNNADINSIEAEVNYRPSRQNLFHLGYAFNHTTTNEKENLEESIPSNNFNLLVAHTFDNRAWLSLAYYFTSGMEYLDSGNPQGPMKRLDLNAGKSFKMAAGQQININVTLQFALDKNTDFLKEYTVENRAYISASYSFE